MANICCSPPDNKFAMLSIRADNWGNKSSILFRFQGEVWLFLFAEIATRFSRTVKLGKTCLPSGTKAIPFLLILKLSRCSIRTFSKIILPRVIGVIPIIELMEVVFPMPLRPIKVTTSPFLTFIEMPNRAWLAP